MLGSASCEPARMRINVAFLLCFLRCAYTYGVDSLS